MSDVGLFGLDAGKHHLVSLLLHAANAVLLFLALASMTGASWRSGLVAGLFALHPLHMESVAWVAERKDVLSGTFCMIALLAYVRYARRPGLGRYLPVALSMALGLMAKPMIVTLPFVLLLLDFWPLARYRPADHPSDFAPAPLHAVILEKVPLFLLSAASSVVTLFAQRKGGAIVASDILPFHARAANAAVAYAEYILATVWPKDLTVYYPHMSASLPVWQIAGSIALLAGLTGLILRHSMTKRYAVVGWLWFLGTLVPVSGLIQVGGQARADRYTYIPLIGLFVIAAWGIPDAFGRCRRIQRMLPVGGIAVLLACSAGTWVQLRFWESNEALFRHALAVTADNWMAHTNLGKGLFREGRIDEAIHHFGEAFRIKPGSAIASANLGAALGRAGRADEASVLLKAAVRVDPSDGNVWFNLGVLLLQQADPAGAVAAFREAARLDPGNHWNRYYLGVSLFTEGKTEEAIAQYRTALEIWPGSVEGQTALAVALAQQGRMEEALLRFREAYRLDPGNPVTRQNLEAAVRSRAGR
jgi:Flp pilus assembly protein TadD